MYYTYAAQDVYALIQAAAGDDFEMVFLDADDDDERSRKIADVDVVVCAVKPFKTEHLLAAKKLKVIHHQGVGWQDTTDWREIKRLGIPLAITTAGTTVGVAEHTVLLMLAAAKRLPYVDSELRAGHWHINTQRGVSRELFGKTVGYVGMGRIAQAVAERLKAFGCSGIYFDPFVELPESEATSLGLRSGDLDEVLASAEFLSIHVPLTEGTRDLIDTAAFRKMKSDCILVNTSRGGIVNEPALAEALESGDILAAGLDVYEQEPPDPDNPLFTLPNIVITPHISAGTRDAMSNKMNALFDNLRRFFATGELDNRVEFP
jgi:phosphoglycerate dehydrogenase-like enzyme